MSGSHPEIRTGQVFFRPSISVPDNDFSGGLTRTDLNVSKGVHFDYVADVYLGRYVMIGRGSFIYTHDHVHQGKEPLLLNNRIVYRDKTIEDDVWIHGAIVLMQCDFIARGVVIGAGSVITKPIPEEYSIWAGNPARRIGSRIV